MNDIEALAKRIILIGKGTILYDGTLSNLKKKYDKNKYITIMTDDKFISHKKGIIKQEKISNGYNFTIDTSILDISTFLNYLSDKADIKDIDIQNENIDNIIINLYQEYKI